MKKKLVLSIFAFLILILISTSLFVFLKNRQKIEYNNFSFFINKSKVSLENRTEVQVNDYLGTTYTSGSLTFAIKGGPTVYYNLRDKELPPSNALNDLYPILKANDQTQQEVFEVDFNKYGFSYIVCNKDTLVNVIDCKAASDKAKTSYNYGVITSSENYYFATPVNMLGMSWTTIEFKLSDTSLISNKEVNDFLGLHESIMKAQIIKR